MFHKYPLYMTNSDGRDVIVENAAEEAAVKSGCNATGRNPSALKFNYPAETPSPKIMKGELVIPEDLPDFKEPSTEEQKPIKVELIEDKEDNKNPLFNVPTIEDLPEISSLTSNNTLEDLRNEADSYGVIYDKRWGVDRLNNAIADAKKKSA